MTGPGPLHLLFEIFAKRPTGVLRNWIGTICWRRRVLRALDQRRRG